MKKLLIMRVILFLIVPLSLFPRDDTDVHIQPAFLPFCADVMGMGGAFTASSKGYSSLFYNPAGFALGDYSLTFVTAGLYSYIDPLTFVGFSRMDQSDKVETITRKILSGGYGNGLHAGIGFVKSGLGIGASFIMDSNLNGTDTLATATGSVHMSLGFILGYAQKFSFSDMIVSIGADIRPMARVYVPVSSEPVADMLTLYAGGCGDLFEILESENALHGIGIGFDLGVITQYKNLKFGVSVRDIGGTQFDYRENTFGDVIDTVAQSGIFPQNGSKPDGIYRIPMNVSAGISYHPDLGSLSKTIDPQVHFDLDDIVNNFIEEKDFLLMLHLGVEATLFDTLTIRGGFAQGHFSAGMGIHLLFLDVDAAFFTQEKGRTPGDIPSTCSLIELAVRMKL
ncbi:MAG: conjugal transfer protein TraF [Spirochaetales bacterium]|nr:conjugal transfer protein TraF [Spirochaetales bacterium]